MKKILIVEDQFVEAANLERMLVKAGYSVCGIARSVKAALDILNSVRPDFVLLDIYLKGDQTGIELAGILKEQGIPFLYLSANSNKSTLDAAKATRPYGFLVKPFREQDVLAMMEIAAYQQENRHQPAAIGGSPETQVADIVGGSEALQQTLRLTGIVAPSDTTVLILGESGTGKEKIASALHLLSRRKNNPFIKVNCAAMPASLVESILFGHEKGAFTGATSRAIGKFEQAHGGTIFLDEIGEMLPEVQVKILRVLQEKEIERIGGRELIKTDVRVIAATNRNLETEVAEGRFRMDLYYRLNVFPIQVAPLRERKQDIIALTEHFIRQYCQIEGREPIQLQPALREKLLGWHWPGNIRELENVVKRIVLLGAESGSDFIHYSGNNIAPVAASQTLQENERAYIISTLKQCNGKISGAGGAAQLLNLPASTLESKMKKLGITKEDYAPATGSGN
ncbi:sigma-54-dependent transcriptional regulator [Flavihumibacter petaseus]|uniref:Putative two-component response regulator n=1 Tax=Flavihumibacter petaseus NBRC 106054 TaxID=1220578 RepID=A0A0E9N2Q9_9BACT|nr:sigma-54 dependent transcriptional regulator [Flavihumibacter petaseus]GAO44083.1 putative two-component response regulator [Flavihumibacter petaseus NBRC 106054]